METTSKVKGTKPKMANNMNSDMGSMRTYYDLFCKIKLFLQKETNYFDAQIARSIVLSAVIIIFAHSFTQM